MKNAMLTPGEDHNADMEKFKKWFSNLNPAQKKTFLLYLRLLFPTEFTPASTATEEDISVSLSEDFRTFLILKLVSLLTSEQKELILRILETMKH